MREIKFRAWHNGKMLYHNPMMSTHDFIITPDGKVFYTDEPGYVNGKNQGSIIMQYTGLKDKNGKEIYEGDVVKMEDGTGHVFYDDMEAAFLMEYHPSYFLRIGCGDEIEILGNIYENPDLISYETKS